MNTREKILADAEKKIVELEKEQNVMGWLKALGVVAAHTSLHTWKGRPEFFSTTISKKYPNRLSFLEAFEVYEKLEEFVTPSEKWKNGTLSIRPVAINSEASNPNAVSEGETWASVTLNAGQGYQAHQLSFWVSSPFGLVEINVELSPPWKWLPQVENKFDHKTGECLSSKVLAVGIGEDSLNRWWSPAGSYRLQYQWADSHNFRAFASTVQN